MICSNLLRYLLRDPTIVQTKWSVLVNYGYKNNAYCHEGLFAVKKQNRGYGSWI